MKAASRLSDSGSLTLSDNLADLRNKSARMNSHLVAARLQAARAGRDANGKGEGVPLVTRTG